MLLNNRFFLVWSTLFNAVFVIFFAFIGAGSVFADNRFCQNVEFKSNSKDKISIVFSFDKPYRCGQFLNGDWWVSPPDKGGVAITEISPSSTTEFNGQQINPVSKIQHALDVRVPGFKSTLALSLPVTVKGVASVLKVVSVDPALKKCRPCLKFSAVLTVLDTPIKDGGFFFRPGYFGYKKLLISKNDIMYEKIPKYNGYPVFSKSLNYYYERYRNLQLDHIENWVGRDIHPIDSMPDYGADIARDNSEVLLTLMGSDRAKKPEEFDRLLWVYLQMGLDLYSMASGGVEWPPNGGHGNGRKLPLLFAGVVLNLHEAVKLAVDGRFSEDKQIYHSETIGRSLYGTSCSELEYWRRVTHGKGSRTCRDPYGFIDGGGAEIGGAYQLCCTAMPWKYTALAVRMLDLEKQWSYPPFFEYVDRWVEHGVWAAPDPCSLREDLNGLSMDIRVATLKNCSRGGGRYISKHGAERDGGLYRSELGDRLWRLYSDGVLKKAVN